MGMMFNASAGNEFRWEPKDTITKKPMFCIIAATVVTQTNEKCYGQSNGDAVLFVAGEIGGSGPYTWSWSPTVTDFSADTLDGANGLSAGTYTVTITDGTGCSNTVNVNITQPAPLTVTTSSVTNDKCNAGNNGAATVVAGGGTPSYTYNWTPSGGSAATANSLTAGTYVVNVADSNRCRNSDTITITQPNAILDTMFVVPSSCKTPNGSVGVTASNGVGSYTYSWAPGGNTTDSITGLSAGSYTCIVTDGNGCSINPSAIVTDSTTLKDSLISATNITCFGSANGSALFRVTGGMGPDTYSWSPSGGTDTAASGLGPNTYVFTATDSVGCMALSTVLITQPNVLHDTMTGIREVACYGQTTGRATVNVTGGTSPYTYSWSSGSTANNIRNVSAGTYTVTVTDSNGCSNIDSVTIIQPATAVTDSNIITNATCYGSNNGSIIVNPYGGVSPYTYTWTPPGNTSNTATGLSAGTYIVSIRDSNKCRLRDTVTVNQPPAFIVQADTTVSMPCNNKAWVVLTGPTSKYTYSWSPSGGNKDTATGLCAGTYTCTVTDSAGCVEVDSVLVGTAVGIQQYSYNPTIKVYPVPTNSKLTINVTDNSFAANTISVYDMTGREVSTEKVIPNANSYTIDVSRLAEGTYFLKMVGASRVEMVKFSVAGK